MIPYMNLGRMFEQHEDELTKIFKEIGASGKYVNGAAVTDFELNCSAVAARPYAVSVATATDGLYLLMKAMDIGEGDEVITTAYSYIATAEAIAKTGATAVFADVDDHYHIDLDYADSIVQPNTKAMLIVNLFGDMMDYDALNAFAKKNNLLIIEDAAQSFGSSYGGVPSGAYGYASVYSFSPSKQISGMGHGACVVTDDKILANRVKMLARHGQWGGRFECPGHNSIISSTEAGWLNYFIGIREELLQRRREIANMYVRELSGLSQIKMPLVRLGTTHSWHKFVIRVDDGDRDMFQNKLNEAGIETQIHYRELMPRAMYFYNYKEYPNAQRLSEQSISLPIYPELTDEEVWTIINEIRKVDGTCYLTTPSHNLDVANQSHP